VATQNGHTEIPNYVLDKLKSFPLSGNEFMVLIAIIRRTLGWRKTEDTIALTQLSEDTGIRKQHVYRALREMSSKMVISVTKNGYNLASTFSLNLNVDEWKASEGVTKNGYKNVTENGYVNVTKFGNIKRKERNINKIKKESIKKEKHGTYVFLLSKEYEKLVGLFTKEGADKRIEALDGYLKSIGQPTKYKDHYETILSWERKDEKIRQERERRLGAVAISRGRNPRQLPKTYIDHTDPRLLEDTDPPKDSPK
jgi:phage replication O-like protein O